MLELTEMFRLDKMFRTKACDMSLNASLNKKLNRHGPMAKYRATCNMKTSLTRNFSKHGFQHLVERGFEC
jgi:hypothetical protein